MTFFHSRGRRGTLPDGCPERVIMYQMWAEAYGWTPEQCDRLPDDFATWDPVIREAKHRVREMRQREADLKARARR